ncbi:tail protein X [Wolbachia endosymbiont (group B) of Aricia artaxerxes]
MTVHYIARENEMLDYICFKHYGYSSGAVEIVLEANPGRLCCIASVG